MSESVRPPDGEPAAVSGSMSAAMAAHRRGDLAQAERLYRQQLEQPAQREEGGDPVLWTNLGQLLRQSGRREEALRCYRHAALLPHAPAATHFNLGNTLMEGGSLSEAEASFRRAWQLQPDMPGTDLQLARCVARQQRTAEAVRLYRELLGRDGGNHSAWLELGNLQRGLGHAVAATESYRMSVRCAPGRWGNHASLARMLEERGERDAAAPVWRQALALAPDAWAVRNMMGQTRQAGGDLAGALEAFLGEGGVPGPETPAAALIEAGNTLMGLGRTEAAFGLFKQACATRDEGLLQRLADVLFVHNLWVEAVAVLERAAALYPDRARAFLNLALGQARGWQLEAAQRSLGQARALGCGEAGALPLEAMIHDRLGDAAAAFECYRRLACERNADAPQYRSCAAYASLYVETLTSRDVADMHRELFESWAPTEDERLAMKTAFQGRADPARRLRVGYLTGDLHHQHPVNVFMQPILAHHDCAGMDVTVYYTGRACDAQTRKAKSRAGVWRDVAALSDAVLARCILDDGIDILVDLAGHTGGNRLRLFSRRAAPVQISFLGYPHSTWVPEMDWLIGDPVVTPAGSEALCSEKMLRLPHSVFCYRPEEDYPAPRRASERPLVFGSFNNINKVGERTMRLWARVLDAVPGSRLLLKAPSFRDELACRRYRERFAAHGIGGDRLTLRGPSALADMMAEYADVDIGLDPLQYNGGTTTLQALWMGVPVLTLTGDNFAQRMSTSFVRQIGKEAWIARDEDGYVRNAVALAADRAALAAQQAALRDSMLASPLSDVAAYTRALEAAYRQAWRHYCGVAAA